jgi:hypothetical protein
MGACIGILQENATLAEELDGLQASRAVGRVCHSVPIFV